MNPGGGVLPQSARTSRVMGIIRLMLRSLALMTMQRHEAASKSTRPSSIGQHSSLAPLPVRIWTSPPNTSTHAPNLRVLMGQVSCFGGGSGGGGHSFGGDRWGGHGVSGGGGFAIDGFGITGGFSGERDGGGGFIGGVTWGFSGGRMCTGGDLGG